MNLSFTTLFAALVVSQNAAPIRMQDTHLRPIPATTIPMHESITPMAVSPDGKSIACVSQGGPVVVSFPDGKVLFKPEEDRKERTGYVTFSPDGKRLIGAFPGLHVWDLRTGQRLVSESWTWERQGPKEPPFRFPENEEFPIHPALSPDGKWLYVGGKNNDFRVIDVATGKEVRGIRRRYLEPNSFAPSPDGKILAVTSPDSLFLFDTRTWTEEKVIDLPKLSLTRRFCVRFPIDSEQLFVLGPSGPRGKPEVRIWDRKKGAFTLQLPSLDTCYEPQFAAVTVIGDGRYALINTGSGGLIEIYDLKEKKYVGWTGKEGASRLTLTPDGKHLIGGVGSDHIVVIKVEDVLKTIAAGPQPVVKKKQ